jgi:hypothetical protein
MTCFNIVKAVAKEPATSNNQTTSDDRSLDRLRSVLLELITKTVHLTKLREYFSDNTKYDLNNLGLVA